MQKGAREYVAACVSVCLCAIIHAQTHAHTHVSGVKLNSAGQMLWEWRDKSGRIDLLSPV